MLHETRSQEKKKKKLESLSFTLSCPSQFEILDFLGPGGHLHEFIPESFPSVAQGEGAGLQ